MIGQIGYLGQVPPKLYYVAGSSIGGAAAGLAVGTSGWLVHWLTGWSAGALSRGTLVPVAVLALLGGLRDLGVISFWMPTPKCQVHRFWVTAYGINRASFLWGLSIGSAVNTYYRYAILHVLALWIFLSGNILWGVAVLFAYGFTHGFTVAFSSYTMDFNATMRKWVDTLPHRFVPFLQTSGVCLLGVGALLLVKALG